MHSTYVKCISILILFILMTRSRDSTLCFTLLVSDAVPVARLQCEGHVICAEALNDAQLAVGTGRDSAVFNAPPAVEEAVRMHSSALYPSRKSASEAGAKEMDDDHVPVEESAGAMVFHGNEGFAEVSDTSISKETIVGDRLENKFSFQPPSVDRRQEGGGERRFTESDKLGASEDLGEEFEAPEREVLDKSVAMDATVRTPIRFTSFYQHAAGDKKKRGGSERKTSEGDTPSLDLRSLTHASEGLGQELAALEPLASHPGDVRRVVCPRQLARLVATAMTNFNARFGEKLPILQSCLEMIFIEGA